MSKKIQKQVFCRCGRGRSFLVTRRRRSVAEWLIDLRAAGWQGIDLDRQKAETCNVCTKVTQEQPS